MRWTCSRTLDALLLEQWRGSRGGKARPGPLHRNLGAVISQASSTFTCPPPLQLPHLPRVIFEFELSKFLLFPAFGIFITASPASCGIPPISTFNHLRTTSAPVANLTKPHKRLFSLLQHDLPALTRAPQHTMAATSPQPSTMPPSEMLATPPPRPTQPLPYAPRLGMPFDRRLLLTTSLSFLSGFTLGSLNAGHMASLRFRAENAHRLPISNPGWYLYHKSKNYYKWRYGIVEGFKKGTYIAAWSSVFFIVEESLDIFRGTWRAGRTMEEMEGVDELDMRRIDRGVDGSRDFVSSGLAGMVTGGLWSAWHQFPVSTAARTIRLGLLVGLGFGLGQDGLTWAKKRWGIQESESWIYKGARNKMIEEDVRSSMEKE